MAYMNCANTAQFIVEHGANVNIKNNVGKTPLHYAARVDKKNVYDFLIKNGWDPLIKDNNGKSATLQA